MTGALPVWRSLLFVPVTAKRFVDGASGPGCGSSAGPPSPLARRECEVSQEAEAA